VLILTTFDHDEYVYQAMRAGASGFLLKTVRPGQLTAAIRDIAAGDALLAPDITRRLVEQFVRRPPPGSAIPPALAQLTPREVDELRLITRGLSNTEIAVSNGPGAVNGAVTESGTGSGLAGMRERVAALGGAFTAGPAPDGGWRVHATMIFEESDVDSAAREAG